MFEAIGLYICVNIVFMLIVHYSGLLLPPLTYMIDEVLSTDEQIKIETADFTPTQMSILRKVCFVMLTSVYWIVFCFMIYGFLTSKK